MTLQYMISSTPPPPPSLNPRQCPRSYYQVAAGAPPASSGAGAVAVRVGRSVPGSRRARARRQQRGCSEEALAAEGRRYRPKRE